MKKTKRTILTAALFSAAIGLSSCTFDPSSQFEQDVYGPPVDAAVTDEPATDVMTEPSAAAPTDAPTEPPTAAPTDAPTDPPTEAPTQFDPASQVTPVVYGPPDFFDDYYEDSQVPTEDYHPDQEMPDPMYGPPDSF